MTDSKENYACSKQKPPAALFAALSSSATKKKLRKVKKRDLAVKKSGNEIAPPKYKVNKGLKPKVILVIGFQTNWYAQFKNSALVDGTPLQIEQTLWSYIDLEASSHSTKERLIVDLQPNTSPLPFTSQCKPRRISPDFVLIRNFPTDIHGDSFHNLLLGFMFSGVPSMNSWNSILFGMQRPLIYCALNKLRLPMVPMTYHPNFTARTDRLLTTDGSVPYPKVIKVSSTHSGYGKIRVSDESAMADVRSILILNKDFYTEESLVENIDFEFRIQKIGKHFRGFKRNSSSSWKNNWGNTTFEDYDLDEYHREWIERASTIYGGLDICALDVLKRKDESEVILELNGTACGLMAEHEDEDASYIRDLVIDKMSVMYCADCEESNVNSS